MIMDSNIAKLFGYETKYLNRQIQKNIERFPKDYCFSTNQRRIWNYNTCGNLRIGSHKL